MDRDGLLRRQDLYDLLLQLQLALPYEEYTAMVANCFTAADEDRDGRLSVAEFLALYKALAAAWRAFRRQDHHANGFVRLAGGEGALCEVCVFVEAREWLCYACVEPREGRLCVALHAAAVGCPCCFRPV